MLFSSNVLIIHHLKLALKIELICHRLLISAKLTNIWTHPTLTVQKYCYQAVRLFCIKAKKIEVPDRRFQYDNPIVVVYLT